MEWLKCFFGRPYSLLHVCATNMVNMQGADMPETETLQDVGYRRSQRLTVEGRKGGGNQRDV